MNKIGKFKIYNFCEEFTRYSIKQLKKSLKKSGIPINQEYEINEVIHRDRVYKDEYNGWLNHRCKYCNGKTESNITTIIIY